MRPSTLFDGDMPRAVLCQTNWLSGKETSIVIDTITIYRSGPQQDGPVNGWQTGRIRHAGDQLL